MKPNVAKARKHLARLRDMISKRRSPFSHMTEQQAINKIRKDREQIWEEKLAHRT